MSIDHSILNNLQPVKIEDPLARYANFLAMQNAMNKNEEFQNSLASTAAYNAAMKKALRPDGTYDRGVARSELINSGWGSHVPVAEKGWVDLDKGIADVKKTNADATKVMSDTTANEIKLSRQLLDGVSDEKQALDWVLGSFKNPVLADYHTRNGSTPEKAVSLLQTAIKNGKFADWLNAMKIGSEKVLEQHFVTQGNINGTQRVIAMPKYNTGTPKATVVPGSVAADTPRPTTSIQISTGGKIEEAGGKAFSEEQGKYLSESLKTARMAPQMARDADRALALINGGVFSGKAANLQTEAARVMKAMGIPVGPEVTNTEQLAALLADKVLSAIHTSGLGARGMDTPAERVYVEKAKLGDKTLDRETLIMGANLLKKAANHAVQNYNETAKTAPASWFQGSGAPRSLPSVSTQGEPKSAAPVDKKTWTLNGKVLKVGDVVGGHRYKGGNPNDGKNWE